MFALLLYFATLNLIFGFIGVIIFPLVLGFATESDMGFVLSIGAIGMVIGSLVMSAWAGPQRKVYGLYVAVIGLAIGLIAIGLRPSLPLLTAAAFIAKRPGGGIGPDELSDLVGRVATRDIDPEEPLEWSMVR